MKTIHIYKAQPAVDPHESTTIIIDEELPSRPQVGTLVMARQMFDEQAQLLFDSLIKNLPGGTVDALTVKLLDHQRRLFFVSYKEAE